MIVKARVKQEQSTKYDIHLSNIDAIEGFKMIPDHSIDLIFTDPPYTKKTMYLYSLLAREAKRILKKGHYLFSYCGNYFLPDVLERFHAHLKYHWLIVEPHTGTHPIHWERRIVNGYKPILMYSNGPPIYKCILPDMIKGGGKDKRFHKWGQHISLPLRIIDKFTRKGDLVLDPFLGGGTTAQACKLLERKCRGFELDPESYQIAKDRILEPVLTEY